MSDIEDWTQDIHQGDCLDVLAEMPAESVHAVVTDPPYALGDSGFMGRDWDQFDGSKQYQLWCEEWATKCGRVLKPGGHLLAFGGNTRHHRLNCGIEDAGFEIRDQLTWHYAEGFPKSLDVSKAIDKAADAEREVVGKKHGKDVAMQGGNFTGSRGMENNTATIDVTAPATDAAERWDGFKTGLKPATEFVALARKPFDGTVAECVQTHGTAALNIDGCRVGTDPEGGHWTGNSHDIPDKDLYGNSRSGGERDESGRYPSNVVFDEVAAARLDREVGETTANSYNEYDRSAKADRNTYGDYQDRSGGYHAVGEGYKDSGGPSRYFYTSKASRAERTMDGQIENPHPTVKPLDLMEWLVTLATAEGQIVLDPFAGSGTTCRACKDKGRRFVGIERQAQWCDLARVRCGLTPDDPSNVRGDDDQTGLEAYTDGGEP